MAVQGELINLLPSQQCPFPFFNLNRDYYMGKNVIQEEDAFPYLGDWLVL